MLLVLDPIDKPTTIADIDSIVSAEIPDPKEHPAVIMKFQYIYSFLYEIKFLYNY